MPSETARTMPRTKARTTEATSTLHLVACGLASKAVFQQKNGREFMNLSKSELDKIKKKIEDKIKDDIKKKGL